LSKSHISAALPTHARMDFLFVVVCSVLYSVASFIVTAKMINRQIKLYFQYNLGAHLLELGIIAPAPTAPSVICTTV